jgi:MYXO-CTERM domain-containing protein
MAFVPTGSFAQSTSTPPSCVQGSEFYDAARCAADRLRAGTAPSLVGREATMPPPLSQQVRLFESGGQASGGQAGGEQATGGGEQTSTGSGGASPGSALALIALGGLGLLFLLSRDEEGERGEAARKAVFNSRKFFVAGKRDEEKKKRR